MMRKGVNFFTLIYLLNKCMPKLTVVLDVFFSQLVGSEIAVMEIIFLFSPKITQVRK